MERRKEGREGGRKRGREKGREGGQDEGRRKGGTRCMVKKAKRRKGLRYVYMSKVYMYIKQLSSTHIHTYCHSPIPHVPTGRMPCWVS